MVKNNEIRFKCETELVGKADKIYDTSFSDLKKCAFYKKVFLEGLVAIQNKALELVRRKE